jgi:hypothetical protein
MNNPETLVTLNRQDTGHSNQKPNHNTTQKTRNMSNTDLDKKPGARKGQTGTASYKTYAVLLIQ